MVVRNSFQIVTTKNYSDFHCFPATHILSASFYHLLLGFLISNNYPCQPLFQFFCLSFSWDVIVFFRVPGMMLCFGSKKKTMLITDWCLQLLLSTAVLSQGHSQWRAQGAGREQNQDSWLSGQGDIPYHRTSRRKSFEGGRSSSGSLPLFEGLLGIGQQVVSNCFAPLVICDTHSYTCTHTHTAITIILFLYLSSTSTHKLYPVYYPPVLSPIPLRKGGASKQLCVLSHLQG